MFWGPCELLNVSGRSDGIGLGSGGPGCGSSFQRGLMAALAPCGHCFLQGKRFFPFCLPRTRTSLHSRGWFWGFHCFRAPASGPNFEPSQGHWQPLVSQRPPDPKCGGFAPFPLTVGKAESAGCERLERLLRACICGAGPSLCPCFGIGVD